MLQQDPDWVGSIQASKYCPYMGVLGGNQLSQRKKGVNLVWHLMKFGMGWFV